MAVKDLGNTRPILAPKAALKPPAVPCPRHFAKGDGGGDVWAVQQALRAWGKARRPSHEKDVRGYAPTGKVAFPTINQIKHFQDLHNLPESGVIGPRTWNLLVPFMSGTALDKAKAAYKQYHPETKRDAIARAAMDAYANRAHIHYVQARPFAWHHSHPKHAEGLYAEDCSSLAEWCYWVAGAPDPSGPAYNFNGYGNTDSQVSYMTRTSKPRVGDLAQYHSPGHVAIIVKIDASGIWVVSNGHYPMAYERYNYGHPFTGFYTIPGLD